MGSVFVVVERSGGKRCALKLMNPLLVDDADAQERFRREARTAMSIQNAHVISVLGHGFDSTTETSWIAMELLEGEDLEAVVGRMGPLPVETVREVFRQLGRGLAAAHAHRIVHRDLKPANVFLERSASRAGGFTVKILDFGIAKVVRESQRSITGAMGTPMWAAPEQTSAGSEIGLQTDVWPLGLLAFFLLTGRVFWRSGNVADAPPMALLREIVMDPIPSATRRALDVAGFVLPMGFDDWFARCLVRDPAGRFADGGEACRAMVAALTPAAPQRVISHGGSSAGGASIDAFATTEVQPTAAVDATTRTEDELPTVTFVSMPRAHQTSKCPHCGLAHLSSRLLCPTVGLPFLGSTSPVTARGGRLAELDAPDSVLPVVHRREPREPKTVTLTIPGAPPPLPLAAAPAPSKSSPLFRRKRADFILIGLGTVGALGASLAIGVAATRDPAPPELASITTNVDDSVPVAASADVLQASPTNPVIGSLPDPSGQSSAMPSNSDAPSAPTAEGYLSVICKPFCDSVKVDEVSAGMSPVVKLPVAPGAHVLELRKEGYPTKRLPTEVRAGETSVVRVNMKPEYGF